MKGGEGDWASARQPAPFVVVVGFPEVLGWKQAHRSVNGGKEHVKFTHKYSRQREGSVLLEWRWVDVRLSLEDPQKESLVQKTYL